MPDDFLASILPGPTIGVAPAVIRTRAALAAATADLRALPDAALERPWPWHGEELDVRYGLYRCIEAIEAAAASVGRILDGNGTSAGRSPAARRIGPATAARWDLQGVLATLADDDLDADPGHEQWTVRRTLAHAIYAQRAYGWYTAWWWTRSQDDPDYPQDVPDEIGAAAGLPAEEDEAPGSIADVRDRLDGVLDVAASRFATFGDADLARRARWAGIAVDVDFRIGRWSSHLIEHTVQVDKTLAMLGRAPTEVERLVRLWHAAWGRLEALVFPLPATALASPEAGGTSVDGVLGALATDLAETTRTVRSAAAGQSAPAA